MWQWEMCQRDVILPVLKMEEEGPYAKEFGWVLEAGKLREADGPDSIQKGMQFSWHLDVSPVRLVLDL